MLVFAGPQLAIWQLVLARVCEDGGEVSRPGCDKGIFVGSEVEFVGFVVDCE